MFNSRKGNHKILTEDASRGGHRILIELERINAVNGPCSMFHVPRGS